MCFWHSTPCHICSLLRRDAVRAGVCLRKSPQTHHIFGQTIFPFHVNSHCMTSFFSFPGLGDVLLECQSVPAATLETNIVFSGQDCRSFYVRSRFGPCGNVILQNSSSLRSWHCFRLLFAKCFPVSPFLPDILQCSQPRLLDASIRASACMWMAGVIRIRNRATRRAALPFFPFVSLPVSLFLSLSLSLVLCCQSYLRLLQCFKCNSERLFCLSTNRKKRMKVIIVETDETANTTCTVNNNR